MNCVVCNSPQSDPLYPEIEIVRCQCQHIYYQGDINNEKIKALYTENYFNGDEYVNYLSDKKLLQKNFQQRLKTILKYKNGGKLLEIGSAYGFFLELAQKHFEVKGFEICKEAVNHAVEQLKLNVTDKDFLEDNTIENNYDFICMFDCIEHLASPQLFIEKSSRALKPSGHLILTTGDISSLVPRIRKQKWRLIHPPTHLHYFSKKSITQLLDQYGLQVVEVNYPGHWRSNAQLVEGLFKAKKLAKKIPGSFWINTFDLMEVVAKKK